MNKWYELGKIFATLAGFFIVAASLSISTSLSGLNLAFQSLNYVAMNSSDVYSSAMFLDFMTSMSDFIISGAQSYVLFFYTGAILVSLAVIFAVLGFYEERGKKRKKK